MTKVDVNELLRNFIQPPAAPVAKEFATSTKTYISDIFASFTKVEAEMICEHTRDWLSTNLSTGDSVYVRIEDGTAEIRYTDYNNFAWKMDSTVVVLGSLTEICPSIEKVADGLLRIQFETEEPLELEITAVDPCNELFLSQDGVLLREILYNIFHYEYIKECKIRILLTEANRWRGIVLV